MSRVHSFLFVPLTLSCGLTLTTPAYPITGEDTPGDPVSGELVTVQRGGHICFHSPWEGSRLFCGPVTRVLGALELDVKSPRTPALSVFREAAGRGVRPGEIGSSAS